MANRFANLTALAALLLAGLGLVADAQEEAEASSSPFELVSVARFGERAVAVIGLDGGSRKVIRLGEDLGRTGYVLSEVDAKYVELTKGAEVITLTIDNADPESIARRKAARAAKDKAAEEEPTEPEPKPEKKDISDALKLLKSKLTQKIDGEWMLENADVDAVASAIRRWTTGEDGKPVTVRVLKHRNADPALVTASGNGTTVVDALNMFAKEFSLPYSATYDGRVLLGSGYFFRKQQVGINDTVEDIAGRYQADPGLIREFNPPNPKQGSYIIVPVPVNP